MKLELIDTSTTAGKAEVMRLAAEGRKVATRGISGRDSWSAVGPSNQPLWNWRNYDYAIIAQPVGPDEVWLLFEDGRCVMGPFKNKDAAEACIGAHFRTRSAVRYRRVEE